MSNYFSYFPTVLQDIRQTGRKTQATNILRRFKVKDSLTDRTDTFYEYSIQEGDRPDVIAEKFYGNANYAWVVLHYNNIIDPQFDWPLFGNDFDRFIVGKYGNLQSPKTTIKYYYKILSAATVKTDGTRVEERKLVVDETTYNSLAANERSTITEYDWEVELNEERKQIRLLEPRFLSKAIDEVETILQED